MVIQKKKGAIMTKQQAGSKGGRETFARHGPQHMREIGKAGARATWSRYHLSPVGQSGWAMVDRETGKVKTFVNYIPGR
jgi:general stress protein YciG